MLNTSINKPPKTQYYYHTSIKCTLVKISMTAQTQKTHLCLPDQNLYLLPIYKLVTNLFLFLHEN